MNCPVCAKTMVTSDFGGTHVEVCRDGCKGLWFDWHELAKLDEKNEGAGQALHAALQSPRRNAAERPRLTCPKCKMAMSEHKYAAIREVNVDECYNCRGLFVDSGELGDIREHLVSRAEEDAYANKLISENPGIGKASALQDAQVREVQELRASALKKWAHFARYGLGSRHA